MMQFVFCDTHFKMFAKDIVSEVAAQIHRGDLDWRKVSVRLA